MNHSRKIIAMLALAALGGAASAQGLSHSQLQAELATPPRNGDMLAPSGLTWRQMRPDLYPVNPASDTSRAQVEAEVLAARRDGTLVEASGFREKDVAPGMYPADPVVAGMTRQQVKDELAMAIRDGDMMAAGETGMTENQLNPQRYAHQRALDAASRLAQHDAPQTGSVQ